MAGLKITSPPLGQESTKPQGSRDDPAKHLAATTAAVTGARQLVASLSQILDRWQFALDRASFLHQKTSQYPEYERFHAMEVDGILTDLDEQVQHLRAEPFFTLAQPGLNLEILDQLALTAKDFHVSALGLCAAAEHSITASKALHQELRVANLDDEPALPILTVGQAAQSHLDRQRVIVAEAEAQLDAATSRAQVFAENLSAARSHLSEKRYGPELTKVTTQLMQHHATAAIAAIGGLHGIDDRVFWRE